MSRKFVWLRKFGVWSLLRHYFISFLIFLFYYFSYKEDSEDETDSDDLIEQDDVVEDAPAEDVETIEKVVRHRQGWPGRKFLTVVFSRCESCARNNTRCNHLLRITTWFLLTSTINLSLETGAKTTLYSEEREEIVKRGDPNPEEDETQLQFLIKWKSWSHLHNTWETRDEIVAQGVKGLKKLDNYIKKMEEIAKWYV